MTLAWKEFRRGNPLEDVATHCRGIQHVVMVVVEGLRADVLEEALDEGDLPRLRTMLDEMGSLRYRQAATVFPSVAAPAHATLVTGSWPGDHEVVANEWFWREDWGQTPIKQRRPLRHETREYIKFSVMDPGADPGLANALLSAPGYFRMLNADLGRSRTLYEAYNLKHRGSVEPISNHWLEDTVSVLEPVSRGADHVDRIDQELMEVVLRGIVWGIPGRLMRYLERRQYLDLENQGFDYHALGEVLEHLGRAKIPAVVTAWLPGLDGYSHRSGARQQRKYFRRGRLDHMFGHLHETLVRKNLADDTLICITSDHGHYDAQARRESRLREEDIYQHLRSTAGKGHTFPLTPKGRFSRGNRDATVVATLNGGALFLYVKGEDSRNAGDGWLNRPAQNDLEQLCKGLEKNKAAEKVFAYDSEAGYRQWWKGSFVDLSEWESGDGHPMARERLMGLAGSGRSPDIVVSAAPGYYFSRQTYQGEHGSLRAEDSHVPLMFVSGKLPEKGGTVGGWVSLCDVAPTLAECLGCRGELEGYQDDSERMRAMLALLDEFRKSGPREQWFDYGSAFGSQVEKLFGSGFTRNKAEADYRAILEAVAESVAYRAERFRSRGSISEDLYLGVKDATAQQIGPYLKTTGGRSLGEDEEE